MAEITFEGVQQELRQVRRGRRRRPRGARSGVRGAARPLGLRQDDAPALPRGARAGRRRPGLHRRPGCHRPSAAATAHRDGLPELRRLPAHEGVRQHRLRPRMQKEKKPVIDERVRSSAGLLHIEELLDRYSSQLSGGQRQRVAVARAIATKADVLLMDEPLSNLDALLRLEMRAELKSLLHSLDATTIYVTHDQIEALSMGDRIAVMNKGRIVQLGNPLEVYDNPADTFVGGFIGNPPMNFLEAEVAVNGGTSDRQAQRRLVRAARRDRCARGAQPPARHPGRGDRRRDRGCRRARAGEGDRPRAARLAQPADGALRRGHPEGLDPAGPLPAAGERRLAAPRAGANSLDGSRYGSSRFTRARRSSRPRPRSSRRKPDRDRLRRTP